MAEEKKDRFNIYTVIQDLLEGKESEPGAGNIFEVLGLKEKKNMATTSGQIDISLGTIDVQLDSLMKVIEEKKVDTADINQQFENVQQGTNLAVEAEKQKSLGKKKEEAEVMQLAEQARRNPGAIGMTFAGPDATGVNKLEGLAPSRITSRGKGRGGRL